MKNIVILILIFFALGKSQAQTLGLFTNNASTDGYVLFAPNFANTTYLIDKCGYQVHSWIGTRNPGQAVYLLEDGTLLRTGRINNSAINGGGLGGIIEKVAWDGTVTWAYTISSSTQTQHHDAIMLPNGNVLAIVWVIKTAAEATAAGRNPALVGTTVWSEKIVEIQPSGTNGGTIVWEWNVWDHLVQDFDATKPNFGVVADHPELINLNYNAVSTNADWLHFNGLDYNEALDQIVISNHNHDEIWIIDHSTSMTEATSHSGGAHNRGGDLMYRWGNPASYNRGTTADQKLFGQHNPRWIEEGFPGAGSISIFNNGLQRPGGNYSTVETLTPPIDANGDYAITDGQAYLPSVADWIYAASPTSSFYSMNISGAQRLENGNTIVCSGASGNFFEIDPSNTIVWKYVSPVGQGGNIGTQGSTITQNSVFRCSLYPLDYSGLAGFDLTPGNPIELNPTAYNCNMITGVSDNNEENNASISILNPFSNTLKLQNKRALKNVKITLTGISGNKIGSWFYPVISAGTYTEITLSNALYDGIYFLNIQENNSNKTFKLIHRSN